MRRFAVIAAVLAAIVVLFVVVLFVAAVIALVVAGPALLDQLVKTLGSPSSQNLLRTLTQLRDLFGGGGG